MTSDPLECLGPLDGRYAELAAPLREYFSELALIRRRAMVESEWLLRVNDIPQLQKMKISAKRRDAVRAIAAGMDLRQARKVKALEKKNAPRCQGAGILDGRRIERRWNGGFAPAAAFRLHFVGH